MSLLTTLEVAKKLKVQPHTVRVWRVRGVGPPYIKLGRVVRYREEDVERWLAAHRRGDTHGE